MRPGTSSRRPPSGGAFTRAARFAVLAVAVLGLLGTSACGAPPAERDAPAQNAPAGGGFPVTVTDARGEVTIPAKPQRVVALGYADIAIARALGAEIVGAVAFPQGADGRNFPGIGEPLPADVTTLDLVKPEPEKILALKPDLILATAAQPTFDAAYDQLSTIAPTLTHKTALLLDSPQEITEMIGTALGERDAAAALIAASDRQVDEFAAQRPYLKDHTFAFGQTTPAGLQLIAGDDALSTRLFTRLGLRLPAELAGQAGPDDPLGAVTLSRENLGQLGGADVGFVYFFEPGLERDPVLANLDLVRNDRLRSLDAAQAYAVLQPNPANTRYVLDTIGPTLEKLKP